MNTIYAALLCVLLLALCVAPGNAQSGQSQRSEERRLESVERNSIALFRQAGLQNNTLQVSAMVEMLKNPPHRGYIYTLIHALAQMGAEETLPTIETYIDRTIMAPCNGPDLSNFAVAAKSRLRAEANAKSLLDSQAKARVKIKRFYQELGMTSADLNAAVVEYRAPKTTVDEQGRTRVLFSTAPKVHPIGVYAMRELADMVYQGSYHEIASLPEVSAVNFDKDYPSALKMRLARLPRAERLPTIIQELAKKTVLRSEDDYEIQLAINEGIPASQAAAAQLQSMSAHRERYPSTGFSALFYVLQGVGDESQTPFVESFLHDQDKSVAHSAQIAYRNLSQGLIRERVPAY